MRREFKAIVSMEGSVKDSIKEWSMWCKKIVELGKVESATRPFIKKLLDRVEESVKFVKPDGKHA